MTSTTGVYGDFPDYYYESGNLFGSYLGGKGPRMSRDTKREIAQTGGGMVIYHPTREVGVGDARVVRPSPEKELIAFVQNLVSEEGATDFLLTVAASRGEALKPVELQNPKETLIRFVRSLRAETQRELLARLEAGARAALNAELKRRNGGRRKRKAHQRGARSRSRKGEQTRSATESVCALCGDRLSAAQVRVCLADPLFLGHVYCADHTAKLRTTLGAGEH